MDLMVQRCAGVDIGKDEVVACVRTPGPSGKGNNAYWLDRRRPWFLEACPEGESPDNQG